MAKQVPGPWRWGWWKTHTETAEREFRPLSEINEINPISGIFHHYGPYATPGFPNVVLSHREYGFRFKLWAPRTEAADWHMKDGFIDENEPFSVLDAMVTIQSDCESSVGILATKPIRDLIAAAPDLLAACEKAYRAILDMPVPHRDSALYAARMSCFEAIHKAKETDR